MQNIPASVASVIAALVLSSPAMAQDEGDRDYPITDVQSLIDALGHLDPTELVTRDVQVETSEGLYNFYVQGSSVKSALNALSLAHCGTTVNPVIYVNALGSYEYRWCVHKVGVSAWMDIYAYSGGAFSARGSYDVPCTNTGMPYEVRVATRCP